MEPPSPAGCKRPSCGARRCLAGLETFVSLAKELPAAQLYDVVEGYVKISVECAEIFKLLDGERKPESEVSPEVIPDWEQHCQRDALQRK